MFDINIVYECSHMQDLDKSCIRIIVDGIEQLINPLTELFQLIYKEKKVPAQWKIRPSLHFYGMIFWWKKGLCRVMAWLPFQKRHLKAPKNFQRSRNTGLHDGCTLKFVFTSRVRLLIKIRVFGKSFRIYVLMF